MTDTSKDAVDRLVISMINSGNTTTANMLNALADERDAATAAYWLVRSYAVHDDDCTINRYPNRNACSCGLRNALAAIKETKT